MRLGKMMKMFCCLGRGLEFPDDFSEHGGYSDHTITTNLCPLVEAAKINNVTDVGKLISEGADTLQIDHVRLPTPALLLRLPRLAS